MKKLSQKIPLQAGQSDYTIQLKKPCKWCWLLLLGLLPLLCCIFPCSLPQTFRNVDNETGQGLGGVENIITLDNGKTYTVISDTAGWFKLKPTFNKRLISIKAVGTPINYSVNDTTIHKALYADLKSPAPQSKRTIPLRMGKICVQFRNIDYCDNKPLNKIVNKIRLSDGGELSFESDTSGLFQVCADAHLKPEILSENLRYQMHDTVTNGSKTMREFSGMPQPIDLPMNMKGEIGKLNFRLLWDKPGDVDFRITDPNGHQVDSHERGPNRFTECPCGGKRDLDNTRGGFNSIENIFWQEPPNGEYSIQIQLHDGNTEIGVTVMVRSGCITREFHGTVSPRQREMVVGKVVYPMEN